MPITKFQVPKVLFAGRHCQWEELPGFSVMQKESASRVETPPANGLVKLQVPTAEIVSASVK